MRVPIEESPPQRVGGLAKKIERGEDRGKTAAQIATPPADKPEAKSSAGGQTLFISSGTATAFHDNTKYVPKSVRMDNLQENPKSVSAKTMFSGGFYAFEREWRSAKNDKNGSVGRRKALLSESTPFSDSMTTELLLEIVEFTM